MSIFGTMQASISGMNAQANRLATVGDNISNSNTIGYKRAQSLFSSMVMPSTGGNYGAGGVESRTRYSIAEQGAISYSTSLTDLSIQGAGFFVVKDANNVSFLTRAGSFLADSEGFLTNSAGYRLTGVDILDGAANGVINAGDYADIPIINLSGAAVDLLSEPTTKGRLSGNLPIDHAIVPSTKVNTRPSENTAFTGYTFFTRQQDMSGTTDLYFTKIADNKWEVSAYYDTTGATTGFPYDLTSGDVFNVNETLDFDPTTGEIVSGNALLKPDPADEFYIDLRGITQGGTAAVAAPSYKPNVNFPSDFPAVIAGTVLPSANQPTSSFTNKVELKGYAGLGGNVDLDVYYTKIGADQWEVTVYDSSQSTLGGFPYGAAGDAPLASFNLQYDLATGSLLLPASHGVTLPNGDILPFDFSNTISMPMGTPVPNEGVSISLNLDPTETVSRPRWVGPTASQNLPSSTYHEKTTLSVYDNLGSTVLLDVYYTRQAEGAWEVTVFNNADAGLGGFPYNSAPLVTTTLEFNPVNGKAINPPVIQIPVPNGAVMDLDLFGTTAVDANFISTASGVDGSKVASVVSYEVSSSGVLSAVYSNGKLKAIKQLALAYVESPNNLNLINGNVFQQSNDSGAITLGSPQSLGLGSILAGSIEQSNVDVATELTELIEAQKMYTANSKVFQTGTDFLETIAQLKR